VLSCHEAIEVQIVLGQQTGSHCTSLDRQQSTLHQSFCAGKWTNHSFVMPNNQPSSNTNTNLILQPWSVKLEQPQSLFKWICFQHTEISAVDSNHSTIPQFEVFKPVIPINLFTYSVSDVTTNKVVSYHWQIADCNFHHITPFDKGVFINTTKKLAASGL
jgi:hypothetical protein